MQDILYPFYQPCTDCIYHDCGQHLDSECNGIMNQILEELIWICGDFLRDIGQRDLGRIRMESDRVYLVQRVKWHDCQGLKT